MLYRFYADSLLQNRQGVIILLQDQAKEVQKFYEDVMYLQTQKGKADAGVISNLVADKKKLQKEVKKGKQGKKLLTVLLVVISGIAIVK